MLQSFKNDTSRPLVHTCFKVNTLTISNMCSDFDNQTENLENLSSFTRIRGREDTDSGIKKLKKSEESLSEFEPKLDEAKLPDAFNMLQSFNTNASRHACTFQPRESAIRP